MPSHYQLLHNLHYQLLSYLDFLDSVEELTPTQEIIKQATEEYIEHIEEQKSIHDAYCCACNNE